MRNEGSKQSVRKGERKRERKWEVDGYEGGEGNGVEKEELRTKEGDGGQDEWEDERGKRGRGRKQGNRRRDDNGKVKGCV